MKTVTISLSLTINIGSFSNIKPSAELTYDVPLQTQDQTEEHRKQFNDAMYEHLKRLWLDNLKIHIYAGYNLIKLAVNRKSIVEMQESFNSIIEIYFSANEQMEIKNKLQIN